MLYTETGARAALLDRLLDAAEVSFDRYGVDKVSVEDIATMAGVSRAFVYKRLGSRDGLVLAVLVRRARQFNERARVLLSAQPTMADAIVEGIMLAVKLAHRDPYFGKLVGSATTDPAHRVAGAPEAAARLSDELWRPVLERARLSGELRPGLCIDDAVHWIMCIELILLASKSAFGVADSAHERQLRTLFVPALLDPHADGSPPIPPPVPTTARGDRP